MDPEPNEKRYLWRGALSGQAARYRKGGTVAGPEPITIVHLNTYPVTGGRDLERVDPEPNEMRRLQSGIGDSPATP